jgi:Transposase
MTSESRVGSSAQPGGLAAAPDLSPDLHALASRNPHHFGTGLTNARTEGFNNKAKLVKKRAYGYRSFRNYRLRLLNACA